MTVKPKDIHSKALSYLQTDSLLDNSFLDLELLEEEEYLNSFNKKEEENDFYY